MFDEETCEFDVTVLAETGAALLCHIDGEEEVWIPKSVIDMDASTALKKGETGTVYVRTSWAQKRKLI